MSIIEQGKSLITSKSFWLNAAAMTSGVTGYIVGQVNAKAALGSILFGVLGIIVRTFTSQPITSVLPK